MNRCASLHGVAFLGFAFSLAGALLAQSAPDRKLLVNGKATDIAVLQIGGRSYVDLETVAQITDGSVTFEANQIVLTIPVSKPESAGAPSPQNTQELTKGFASAAISAVAEMKEWKGVLGTMVGFGLAVDGTWAQTYHDRVQTSLMLASAAASTNPDHNALQLLNSQFASLEMWAGNVAAERQALNGAKTVDPNALQSNPLVMKISNCHIFLNTMLMSRIFADNSSCR